MTTALIELEALHRETGNPIFVWEALLAVPLDVPLPGWIREYLAEAGTALLMPLHDQRVTPAAALDRVPAALGLSKPGRNGNMFADARRVEREARVAAKIDSVVRRGGKAESITAAAAQQLGVDRSTIQRWRARARRRWKAQEKEVAKKHPT